jgi:3-(3-hydroxy-phenyl)propionate hydroxylase
MPADATEVLVVGGGPTGLAAANALGLRGVDVLLVEQDPGVAELPRAVSVDDEAMRFMQALGLLEPATAVTLPGTGTKYYGARGQLLAYARGPERQRYGHPVKNPMDHAEFQQMLLDGLARFPCVEVRHATRLVSFTQDGDGVVAQLEGPDGPEEVRAQLLVGADGGRSLVRRIIDEEPMRGSAFAERWLVLDTRNDAHDERYAMHHGDPERPRVVVVGREGRCRYEFLVHDDEHPEGEAELLAFARELVAPYRDLDVADVVRCTIYQFYALVAERFRVGRVLIAGDAAHMMPPFAGQGLNSGLRDAANLAWKATAVLRGQGGLELLDSYGAERRPHVRAMVDLSVRMGAVMMTRSRARATTRDLSFTVGQRLPLFRRFFREMRFKPPATYGAGLFVGAGDGGVVGSMLVQPWVLDELGALTRLDEVTGPGFALLGIDLAPGALGALSAPLWSRLEAARVEVVFDDRLPRPGIGAISVADADGLLAEQLGPLRGKVVLVRPDRFIAGAFDPAGEQAFAAALQRGLGEPEPAATAPLEAA